MTLERLIKIVIDAVESVINRKTFAYLVDKKNSNELNEFLGNYIFPKIINSFEEIPNTLILDSLPIEYISKLSMLITDDELLRFINKVVLSGGEVIILKRPCLSNSPDSYKSLVNKYIDILKSFNISFYEENKALNTEKTSNSAVFDGNVFSKSDLLRYRGLNEVYVKNSVVITQLAIDEAKKLNINIIKK